jgi:hypothetical protein
LHDGQSTAPEIEPAQSGRLPLRTRPDHRPLAGIDELADAGAACERAADDVLGNGPAKAMVLADRAIAADPIQASFMLIRVRVSKCSLIIRRASVR